MSCFRQDLRDLLESHAPRPWDRSDHMPLQKPNPGQEKRDGLVECLLGGNTSRFINIAIETTPHNYFLGCSQGFQPLQTSEGVRGKGRDHVAEENPRKSRRQTGANESQLIYIADTSGVLELLSNYDGARCGCSVKLVSSKPKPRGSARASSSYNISFWRKSGPSQGLKSLVHAQSKNMLATITV